MWLLPLAFLTAGLVAVPQAGPPDHGRITLRDQNPESKPWLPKFYERDPKILLKFDRKPDDFSNDSVAVRRAFLEEELPELPALPLVIELLKVDPSPISTRSRPG